MLDPSRRRPMYNPLFLNTILLGGTPQQKIAAAGGIEDVAATLRRADMGLTDFQVLMDFDGAPGARRDAKRAEALKMLDMAVRLGAGTLLTPASTDAACDATRIVDDLRWLAREAAARKLRIAYESMAWSTINNTTLAAWRSVQPANQPNLGMVIDAFHIFVRGRDAGDLDGIPADRIFLVQLSDLGDAIAPDAVIDTARHRRLLPGAGHFPIASLLQRLEALHYDGPVGLEVFNDAMHAREPAAVAREAMAALRAALAGSRRAPVP